MRVISKSRGSRISAARAPSVRDRACAPRTLDQARGDTTMTSLRTIAVAGLLSVIASGPALAQAAIQEPGLFAFYHPNLDVLNGGAPTPAYRLQSAPPSAMEAYSLRESGFAAPHVSHRGRR
jgi:hypothetical protein